MVARPYETSKSNAAEPQIYEVMKRDEKAKEAAERARLLYVAMTRARDWLVLGGSVTSAGRGKVPADSLMEPFASELGIVGMSDGTQLSGTGWRAEVRRRGNGGGRPARSTVRRRLDVLARRLDEAPVISATQRTFAVTTWRIACIPPMKEPGTGGVPKPGALDPLLRGTLVHRYFEKWDFRTGPPDVASFLRREMPAARLEDRLCEALESATARFMASDAWKLVTEAVDIQRRAIHSARGGCLGRGGDRRHPRRRHDSGL